jgi:hypothetical protein
MTSVTRHSNARLPRIFGATDSPDLSGTLRRADGTFDEVPPDVLAALGPRPSRVAVARLAP